MKWENIEENLIRHYGKNYHNYPQCVEWYIKMMKMIYQEKKKELTAPTDE